MPSVADLPAPPPGRTGWPWTEGDPPGTASATDEDVTRGRARAETPISVVLPVKDGAAHVEEALRSLLLQGYAGASVTVADGGSTDATLEIVLRYAPHLAAIRRGPDRGQADGLAQAFAGASGEILAWLNADDVLLPGALAAVGEAWTRSPGAIVAGRVVHVGEDGTRWTVAPRGLDRARVLRYWDGECTWQQPGTFFPRRAVEAVGGIDPALEYAMDYDLLCRLLDRQVPVVPLERELAVFRHHAAAKTARAEGPMALETACVAARHSRGESAAAARGRRRFARRALLGAARRAWRRGDLRAAAWAALAVTRVP